MTMQCQVTAVTRVNYLGNAKKVQTISSTKEVEFVTQPPEGSGGVFCSFVPPPVESRFPPVVSQRSVCPLFSLQRRKVSSVSVFKTMCLLALRLLA